MNIFISNTSHFFYKQIIKKLFFLLDPEFVHDQNVRAGVQLGKSSFFKNVISQMWAYQDSRLVKELDGIIFPNPVGLSAGFDYNGDLTQILPSLGFGFHTIGTVTMKPYEGNPKPRLGRFPRSQSLLVNKGLKSEGAPAIVKKLQQVTFQIPTGISVASTNKQYPTENDQIQDICECFTLFEHSKLKLAYYELNISCPNTFGGEPFTSPAKLDRLMSKMDKLKLSKPLYIKMPIDQSEDDTLALLYALKDHNAQGVVFGNLTKDKTNPDVDAKDRKIWLTARGNLSGKPTWERSNRLVKLTRDHFKKRFTIIGTGGVFSGKDAYQKMTLGADLVQLITGVIYEGPELIGKMNYDLVHKYKVQDLLK